MKRRRTIRLADLPDDMQQMLTDEILHWMGEGAFERANAFKFPVRRLALRDVEPFLLNDAEDEERALEMPDVA